MTLTCWNLFSKTLRWPLSFWHITCLITHFLWSKLAPLAANSVLGAPPSFHLVFSLDFHGRSAFHSQSLAAPTLQQLGLLLSFCVCVFFKCFRRGVDWNSNQLSTFPCRCVISKTFFLVVVCVFYVFAYSDGFPSFELATRVSVFFFLFFFSWCLARWRRFLFPPLSVRVWACRFFLKALLDVLLPFLGRLYFNL